MQTYLDRVIEEKWLASSTFGSLIVHAHSRGVLMDAVRIDAACNGTTSKNLSLNVAVTPNAAVFLQGNGGVLLDGIAGAIGIAVHAEVHTISRAVAIECLILLAGHIWDGVLVNPAVSSMRVAAIAGPSISAVDQRLNGWDHITAKTLFGDLNTICDAGNCSVSPATAAVAKRNLTHTHTQKPNNITHTNTQECAGLDRWS